MVLADQTAAIRRELQQLLPTGIVWDIEDDSVFDKLLLAMAEETSRIQTRACDLLREADPRRATELIGEWERLMGLPDPCIGELSSLEERRNAVLGKLTNRGGQSIKFFIEFAQSLGFVISIQENREFRVGISAVGDPLSNGEWVFVWEVHAPFSTGVPFRVGFSAAGDPLISYGTSSLECMFEDHKPAHTKVVFYYDQGLILPAPLVLQIGAQTPKVFPIKPSPLEYRLSVPTTAGVVL